MKRALLAILAFVLSVTVLAQEAPKKVAVFVQNRTNIKGMDDEIDGIRDRLTAALASTDAISVVDSSQVADSFRRYKVTTAEERAGLVGGIFSGGSVTRVAKMVGCDYILAASVVGASVQKRNMGGRLASVFTLRMTLKVMDANGASVFAMPPWTRQLPIVDAVDEPLEYFNMLLDQWSEDAGADVANNAAKWRPGDGQLAPPVMFRVMTSVDKTIAELESQTKGAKGEQLVELRRVCGGASVELDGAVIGSAPGDFSATPGLHQIRVTREWMKPYVATVNITEGMVLDVALEMTEAGMQKWGSVESLRADLAVRYAEAAMRRGLRVNLDTRNVSVIGETAMPMITTPIVPAPAAGAAN